MTSVLSNSGMSSFLPEMPPSRRSIRALLLVAAIRLEQVVRFREMLRGCPILGTAEPHASVPAAKAYGDDDHVPIGRVLDCVNRL
jgi:hypothetical protein